MNCPKCQIPLNSNGLILATDKPEGRNCFNYVPKADKLAKCWKCPECGYSELIKETMPIGGQTITECSVCGGAAANSGGHSRAECRKEFEALRAELDYLRQMQAIPCFTPDPKDWIEDFSHENGQYQNRCIECESLFMGYKRRIICKLCASND